MTKELTGIFGIEKWKEVIKAAGQQIIDSADLIVEENVRTIEITIKGVSPYEIPVIEIKKEYNIQKLPEIIKKN